MPTTAPTRCLRLCTSSSSAPCSFATGRTRINPPRSTGRAAIPPAGGRGAVQHGGRELSYLNLLDAEAAWQLAHELVGPDGLSFGGGLAAVVIVKHTNPCGVAVAEDLATAYRRALEGDPVSAFGGIVALSGRVDEALAGEIVESPLADLLIAPVFDDGALARFAAKRKNMRMIAAPFPSRRRTQPSPGQRGLPCPDRDRFRSAPETWQVATRLAPSEQQWRDLELAWRVCGLTSSNAIVLAYGGSSQVSDGAAATAWTRPGSPVARLPDEDKEEQGPVTHFSRFEMGWTQ